MKKPSVVFDAPDLAVPGQTVSEAEVAFFVANGFVVKKGLLADAPLAEALDRVWTHLLDRVPIDRRSGWTLRRDDPSTWRQPRWASMPPVPKAGAYEGRQAIVHAGNTVKLHDLGRADYLLELLPRRPEVRRAAAALLGNLRASQRTRGVYALFPAAADHDAVAEERRVVAALQPHTDRVCQQLNACLYLDDVPPRNGGFTLYPGSHAIMFKAHRFAANWSPLPTFGDALRRVVAEIEPVEIAGEAGDVVFWHGRTVHSPGVHLGDRIRWAVFADFTHDRQTLNDDEHRACGQFEWFKDTRLFRQDFDAGADMWEGWRLATPA